jgi:ribosome-associated toxin RatA of RatAB toxin-antitoxin module
MSRNHQVDRSAIVPFTAEAMFDLVADVESYPQFLPGCSAARVHARDGCEVVASLALAQGPLRLEFTTRNQLTPHDHIAMILVDGPFSDLRGQWDFVPLGATGSRISLSLSFAFESRAMDLLLGAPFEALCNRLVDTFVQRARALHA